jgi:hypothetical protein
MRDDAAELEYVQGQIARLRAIGNPSARDASTLRELLRTRHKIQKRAAKRWSAEPDPEPTGERSDLARRLLEQGAADEPHPPADQVVWRQREPQPPAPHVPDPLTPVHTAQEPTSVPDTPRLPESPLAWRAERETERKRLEEIADDRSGLKTEAEARRFDAVLAEEASGLGRPELAEDVEFARFTAAARRLARPRLQRPGKRTAPHLLARVRAAPTPAPDGG